MHPLRSIRTAAHPPRTQTIARFEQGVETPHAAEAAGKGDLRQAQPGFAEQALRQQQPLRLRQLDRRYPELGLGHPPQVAVADPERRREIADFGAGKCVLFDAGDGRADQPAYRIDRREARRALRPASQARPESRAFRGRCTGIEAHIAALRRTRRANWTAINAGRRDGHEKPPVESTVAGAHRTKTSIGIEFHGCRIAKTGSEYSPFSDLNMKPYLDPDRLELGLVHRACPQPQVPHDSLR